MAGIAAHAACLSSARDHFEPAIVQAGVGTEAAVREHRVQREWTEWILLLVLLAVVAETAWAWVCGKAW